MTDAPVMPCMICQTPFAAFGVGWPGLQSSQPDRVRGKRLRVCALDGECHAQAIARAVLATGTRWPWGQEPPALKSRVFEILGDENPETRTANEPRSTLL
ncbi:MAG: hypothetical protein AAF376_18475 [Pseudomonadota bacterium]